MTAKCKLCKSEPPSTKGEIIINIVGNDQLKAVALGEGMLAHFQTYHPKFIKEMVGRANQFNGFCIMNKFVIDDKDVNEGREQMRDFLADIVMEDAPEMDEIIDDDLEGDEDGEEYEDEEENGEETENQIGEPLGEPTRESPNITQINQTKKEDKEPNEVNR